MKLLELWLVTSALLLTFSVLASAQQSAEYKVSPNEPWGDISNLPESPEHSVFHLVLMYLPNRFLDLVDIFKADVGVGPSVGAVVRISKYGQAGVRTFSPVSARVGLLGRRAPAMLEKSSEMGVGPYYTRSKDRRVCNAELGAGLDLFLAGAYLGFCPDELLDFVGGIILLDYKNDDH